MAVRYPGSRAGEGAASPPRAHSGCRGQAPADVSGSAACSRSGDLRVPCRLALARGATVPLASGGSPRGRPTPVCPRSCAPPMGHTGMFARGDDPPDPRLRRHGFAGRRRTRRGRCPPGGTQRCPLRHAGHPSTNSDRYLLTPETPVPDSPHRYAPRHRSPRQPAPVRPETSATPPARTGTPDAETPVPHGRGRRQSPAGTVTVRPTARPNPGTTVTLSGHPSAGRAPHGAPAHPAIRGMGSGGSHDRSIGRGRRGSGR